MVGIFLKYGLQVSVLVNISELRLKSPLRKFAFTNFFLTKTL